MDLGNTIILYRCEYDGPWEGRRPDPDPENWIHQGQVANGHWDATGRWFTEDPEALTFYAADSNGSWRIVKVELPRADVEAYRVSNVPEARFFSRDHETEFFLPRGVAEAAVRDVEMEEIVRSRLAPGLR